MTVYGIDPGPELTAVVRLQGGEILGRVLSSEDALRWARRQAGVTPSLGGRIIACETIHHMGTGMPVGREVFETCFLVGRLMEIFGPELVLVRRSDVKLQLCGSPKAKDSNIRQALIDKWGPPTVKKLVERVGKRGQPLTPKMATVPGPTHMITSHAWSALAIATYALNKAALVDDSDE